MKALSKSLAVTALLAFSFAPLLRAQDAPPPPPDYQGGPGPGPQDQGGPGPGPQDQGGDDQASFQTFYDQLGDQGTWVQTDDYGYVFQPNVNDPDWAPYTDGHWVYTDDGWTWVSDEPWGWATYHYGRWANMDGMGWVWVPGYRWAPAWVSWRYGGGYAGWAPLPPESFVGAEYGGPGIGIGFHFGSDVDINFHIGPGFYNFVRVEDIGEPNYRGHFINRENNFSIINHTRNITNFNVNRNGHGGFRGVTAFGPPIADVNAHARTHVQTVTLTAANQPGRGTLQGNSLSVFAPHVNPGTSHQGKPARVSPTTISHPTFNRGDSVTRPLAVTATIRPQAPTPQAIQEAQQAQAQAPANAGIVTAKTPFKTTLHKPLTSLPPVSQQTRPATTAVTPAIHTGQNNAAPLTGEPVKPHVSQPNATAPAQTFHQPAANSGTQHNAAPFTGESATPSTTQQQFHQQQAGQQPQVEPQPQVHVQKPAPVQNTAPVTHTESFHQSSQNNGGGNPPATHTETFHTQQQPQQQAPRPQVQQQPRPQPQAPAPQPQHQGGNSAGHAGTTNNAPGH